MLLESISPQFDKKVYFVVKAFTRRRTWSPKVRLGPWSGPMRSGIAIFVTFEQGWVEPGARNSAPQCKNDGSWQAGDKQETRGKIVGDEVDG